MSRYRTQEFPSPVVGCVDIQSFKLICLKLLMAEVIVITVYFMCCTNVLTVVLYF